MYQYPYGNAQQLNLDWILKIIQELKSGGSGEVDLEEVANALVSASYDTGNSYRRYDYAFYNNKLYRCINDTTGAWNPSDWTEGTLGDDVSILTRLINTAVITDVKFDTSGTNGKLQQEYGGSYHDVVEVDYTPVQNSKRPLSSNAGYELNAALNSIEETLNSNIDGLVIQQVPDYYINDTSGVLNNPTSGSGWRYIKTPAFAGDKFIISAKGVANPAGYYFADANNNVLAKDTTESLIENVLVEAPENSAWLVLNTNVTWLKTLYCCKLSKTIVVAPNGGDFTSLTEALYTTTDNIFVKSGTYNIVNEYKALFGNNIFSDISDSYTAIGNFRYGLFITNRKVIFETGAYVNCDLTGVLTVDSTHRFSAFNLGINATIDGLECYAPNTWYNIHDDYGDDSYYTNIIENCILYGTPVNANILGGGTRNHSTSIVKNCSI